MALTTITGTFTSISQTNEGYSDWQTLSGAISTGTASGTCYWDGEEGWAESMTELLYCYNTTLTEVSGTYIYKVEVGFNAWGDITQPEDCYLQYYTFVGYDQAYTNDYQLTTDSGNIDWWDVTNVEGLPGFGNWTWSDVLDVEGGVFLYSMASGIYWTGYVDNIYIRVTYTDTAPSSYGLIIRDADGNTTLDTTDYVGKLIYNTTISGGETRTDTVSGVLTGYETNYYSLYGIAQATEVDKLPHKISSTKSGTGYLVVTMTPFSITKTISGALYGMESSDSNIYVVVK